MTSLPRPPDWDDPVSIPDIAPPTRVLVPFDGSHNAERALAWAALVAAAAGAEVVVTVAYEQPMTLRGRGSTYVETVGGELEDEATALAEEAVRVLTGRGLSARGVVVEAEAARAVLDTVDREKCDLVVMGRQGLTAELRRVSSVLDRFRELLQGGVADKVTRHATVPVLVVV
jgi:nucleotide-binding universal stress UspA family protein